MLDANDMDLVREYASRNSEQAFETLVHRHISLVHSVALRHVRNPAHAEEVTQAVFIILARKAASLRQGTVLAGWLYETARLSSGSFLRGEHRRQRREQEAHMQSTVHESANDSTWEQLAPHLDEAMATLGEKDRNAVVLRFFQNKNAREIADSLGVEESAAQKRVSRAVEKLRSFFTKRGVTLTAAVIASVVSANSVQAAPVGLSTTVATAAAKGVGVAGSTLVIVEGALKLMAWMKYKTVMGLGALALITGGALIAVLLHDDSNGPAAPGISTTVQPTIENSNTLAASQETPLREPLTDAAFISLGSPPGGVLVQPDGKIVVASSLFGFFVDPQSGTLGQFRRGAFRLHPDGTLDRSFCCRVELPGSDAHRAHLVPRADGRVFMSGLFDSVDDKPRPGYAMLLPDGRVDESFEPWQGTDVPPRTYLPGGTHPATVLGDGSVAVMSGAIEGPRAPHPLTVYRLDPSGQLMPPGFTNSPSSEFSRPSGLILTLGPVGFWARKPINWLGGTPAGRRPPFQEGAPASDLPGGAPVADLPFERWTEAPSAVDAAAVFKALFEEVPLDLCRYAARLPDGGAILAVRDDVVDGSTKARGRFMRFDKEWRPDFSFTNQYEADLRSCITLKMQPDGKLLVAGIVGRINGEDFSGVVRLNADGTTDHSFRCEITNSTAGRVMDLAVQEDGRLVICGFFTTVNGVKCQHIARLKADGALDKTFKIPFVALQELNAHRRFPVSHLTAEAAAPPTTNAAALAESTAPPETILITSFNVQGGVAVIQFSGSPTQIYILQANESLDAGVWSSIATNQANVTGMGVFRDPDAKAHPTRFYRIATH